MAKKKITLDGTNESWLKGLREKSKGKDKEKKDEKSEEKKDKKAMANRRDIDSIKRLVMTKFAPRGSFTMDDVYMDESGPADLDMYEALDELVREGKLQGPMSDSPSFRSHDMMTYRKATVVKSAGTLLLDDLIRLAHAQPELREDLLPVIAKHKLAQSEKQAQENKTAKKNIRLGDLKMTPGAQSGLDRWMDSFNPDDPEARMYGGVGYFPANPNGKLLRELVGLREFKNLAAMGNNTIYFGFASHVRQEELYGRGVLMTMSSFDAKACANLGMECQRLDDDYNVWFCYIPRDMFQARP